MMLNLAPRGPCVGILIMRPGWDSAERFVRIPQRASSDLEQCNNKAGVLPQREL